MCDPAPDLASEHQASMQLVGLAPAGLVRAGSNDDVVMMNPIAAQRDDDVVVGYLPHVGCV